MPARSSTCFLAMVLGFAMFPSAVSGTLFQLDSGTHDISVTILPGQDAGYVVPIRAGDVLSVHLEVTSGGHVDFFLTNLTAYEAYQASLAGTSYVDSLYYVTDYSRLNVGAIQYTYDSLIDNELVILVDNTANTEGGAVPVGPVTVEGTVTLEPDVWTLRNIMIVAGVGILCVGLMVGVRWKKKA